MMELLVYPVYQEKWGHVVFPDQGVLQVNDFFQFDYIGLADNSPVLKSTITKMR